MSMVLIGSLFMLNATAAAGDLAHANGVELNVTDIPAVGQPSFSGTWGTASVENDPGTDSGDWSDPDGVQNYVTLANRQIDAHGTDDPTAWEASAQLVVMQLTLNPNATQPLLTTGNIETHARCRPPDPAQASVQAAPGTITVLGTPVNPGTTQVSATGAQLGYPGVDHADLTVVRTDNTSTNGSVSASADMTISISGRLYDAEGNVIYDGPITTATMGHVEVTCAPDTTPTITPTITPTPTPTPTITPTTSPTPTITPTTSPTPTPTPTITPTTSPTPTPTPTIT
ncbi:hypothetical protein HII36_51985, partial [Nonomuraea sp. NN258]|uniref:hypothetical protein n=1 Tax=Nonomuraea antri TaxID=2730852 RepID=UPI0015682FEA